MITGKSPKPKAYELFKEEAGKMPAIDVCAGRIADFDDRPVDSEFSKY